MTRQETPYYQQLEKMLNNAKKQHKKTSKNDYMTRAFISGQIFAITQLQIKFLTQ